MAEERAKAEAGRAALASQVEELRRQEQGLYTRLTDAASAEAVARLRAEQPGATVLGVPTDVADDRAVGRLVAAVETELGPVDIVLNNATIAPVGQPVAETPIDDWDRSYAVNLRGPVLLARACLPSMVARGRGVFVCVSSTGGPYMGAYETLKAAQVALGSTLDAELSGTGVVAFTIGPGLVKTATAVAAIERLAPRLGLSVDELYAMNRAAVVTVESLIAVGSRPSKARSRQSRAGAVSPASARARRRRTRS